jgi:hypothetical protein
MYDWEARKRKVLELNNHPVRHIPEFGGMGMTLCGILSYTYGSLTGKPLCPKCAEIKKQLKENKREKKR